MCYIYIKMSNYNRVIVSIVGLGLLISSFVFLSSDSYYTSSIKDHLPPMRGLCWVAGDSIAAHNLQQIVDVGANWISQTPFGWMEGHDNPKVQGNFDRAWWGETDKGIIHTTEHAKDVGIKTMLKPHIWLRRSGDKWRSDIAMNSEEEWDQWFESYQSWILHYAEVAQEGRIESLCIGTELHQTIKRTDQWRHIIAEIRKVYDGQLTYAANWYEEYEDVQFWDDLDYIGIQAYFPLSKTLYPKKNDLKKAWSKHATQLAKFSKKHNKQIVFTEIGYKNTADAAHEPWTWPQDLQEDVIISDETQQLCYEALFESVWGQDWFDGLFIWKWFHTSHAYTTFEEYFVANDKRRKERASQRNRELGPPVYFSPQRTSSIHVISEWYSKATQPID
jgi:hypothetical protein